MFGQNQILITTVCVIIPIYLQYSLCFIFLQIEYDDRQAEGNHQVGGRRRNQDIRSGKLDKHTAVY